MKLEEFRELYPDIDLIDESIDPKRSHKDIDSFLDKLEDTE